MPFPDRLQDYQRMLDLMRDIILATDLAHHLRIFKDLQKMAEGATPRCWGGMGGLAWRSAHLNICRGSVLSLAHSWLWCPSSAAQCYLPAPVRCALLPVEHSRSTLGQAVGPLLSEGTGAWTLPLDSIVPQQWVMTEPTNSTTGFFSASS